MGEPPQVGEYKAMVVDPPWQVKKILRRKFPKQGEFLDYPTMSILDINRIPVGSWAARDCFLWLWATCGKDYLTREPILSQAFRCLRLWGFKYYTMLTWDKSTGLCPFGTYQITTEHVLVGYRGACKFPNESMGKLQTGFKAPVTRHSEKPRIFYHNIRTHFEGPRLDVFGRRTHEGFDQWGNEAIKKGEQ